MDLVILAFIKGIFWTGIVEIIVNVIARLAGYESESKGWTAGEMLFIGAVCAFIKAKKLGLI
ncbi:hypothetical protein IJL65_05230 [bacterium]|nr:hypothetical protein [bacterium]